MIACHIFSPIPSSSLLLVLVLIISLLLQQPQPALGAIATYLPITYNIASNAEECLYERITKPNEHLTAGVFVLSGEELRTAIVLEGPVAPVDLDLNDAKNNVRKHQGKGDVGGGGRELQRYLSRYETEGTNMFVNGKFGDSMMDVKPVRIAEVVDFEEEEEDYFDDYYMTDKEREEFNKHHDLEHQHVKMDRPPHDHPPLPRDHPDHDEHEHEDEGGEEENEEENDQKQGRRLPHGSEDEEYDDDYTRFHEEKLREELRNEAMLDDDFVKLQLEDWKDHQGGGGAPARRQIVDKPPPPPDEDKKEEKPPSKREEQHHHRRLREEMKLLAGEPYQKTIKVESPGWYRLCVHPKSHSIEVEMELRKSSTYGKVDPRTGHVPSLEEVEIHSEIHALFEKEDDATILAEEGAIKDEDLLATKEQLRILEKVYSDIIKKQLEERRTLNWRTIKNQHLHSHLVLGNLVETIVYMGITGWQVYTIRKWFGGGLTLGRA